MAEILGVPLAPEVRRQLPPAMSEPYVMEWYPEDGGYASLAVQAFDPLSGTLDGINSAGLAVSIMADEEALGALGPLFEWGSALFGHPTKFPAIDLSVMMPLLFGMLGLGGMRTYEKTNGVQSGH